MTPLSMPVPLMSPSALEEYERGRPTERARLREELEAATAERSRAVGWLITLGFGPATLVAVLLALIVEGSIDLAIAFALLGLGVTGLRAWRAHRQVRELEAALLDTMDGS